MTDFHEHPAPFPVRNWTQLCEYVCKKRGLTMEQLYSDTKRFVISHARHEVYYLAAKETYYSWPWMGDKFGHDHTSAMYGAWSHETRNNLGDGGPFKKRGTKEMPARALTTEAPSRKRPFTRKRRVKPKKPTPMTLHTPDRSRVYAPRVHSNCGLEA